MASRVNVRFVIILSTVLVLVATGTALLAWKVVFKSAADLAAAGDVKMAEGEIRAAELLYSKAVNKDPYNSIYLLKWEEALEKWTPETDRELQNEFNATYILVRRQLALSDNRANINYQIEYADLLWQLASMSGFSRNAFEAVVNACDEQILVHETIRPEDTSWLPLRRYRGLANSRIMLGGLELSNADEEQTWADLEAAYQNDPTDYQVLEAMVTLKRVDANNARTLSRITDAETLEQESFALVNEYIEHNRSDPVLSVMGELLLTEMEFREEASAIVADRGPAATPALQALTAQYQTRTAELASRLAATDPALVNRRALTRLFNLEALTDPTRKFEASLPVIVRARDAHADDPTIALSHADILRTRNEYDDAITELQTVIDRPRLPLGLDSVILINAKTSAMIAKVQTAVEAHGNAETDTDRERWLSTAKSARQNLSQVMPEASPPVQLLDARIALAEGNRRDAQQLVDAYNRTTNNADRDALWLAARIAQELNQPGNTRTALTRLLELDPTMAAANVALAEVEYNLGRLQEARELLVIAQTSNPNDPYVRERVKMIDERLGNIEAEDPVDGAIFAARRVANGDEGQISDVASAITMLQSAIDTLGPDPKLYIEKARIEMLNEDSEAATATIAAGLEQFPDNEDLNRISTGLRGMASVDVLVQSIRESDRTDLQKEVAVYAAYARAGRTDDANSALDRAAQLDPNDPTVIELLFTRASNNEDIDEATRQADKARSTNADGINGLSYRARLLILQDKNDEALAALGQAVEAAPNNTALLRLLGRTQIRMGRTADGIISLERALSIRPDDLNTVMELCQTLMNENRYEQALQLARRSESFGRANTNFMQMLLALEGTAGDKDSARDRREMILTARPDDIRNRISLIDLYIDLGQWDKGRDLIEQSRPLVDGDQSAELALLSVEAKWHADQNDLDSARRAYARYIATREPDQRIIPYMALAQFMVERGATANAITAMQQAVNYQAEGDHRVDHMLGSVLMRFNRFSEAYDAYQRIIAGDPNVDKAVTLRASEALIGMGRLADARAMLDEIPGGNADLTVILLRSRIALQSGDDRAARSMLDDAVLRWPDDHRVWILRAEAEAVVPDLIPDALADLDRAIQLQPGVAEAHRRRAELLARLGRADEAIAAWQNAVRANPANDDLRSALLYTMIRRNMEVEAVQAAEEWFERRPRDAQHRARVAELFLLGGMRRAATDMYLAAFEIDKTPSLVLRLADLLVGEEPPRYNEAERVFTDARSIVVTDPALMLARARIYARTGRMEAARNDCLGSFGLLTNRNADRMTYWYTTMRAVFETPRDALSFINQLSTVPGAAEWSSLFTSRVLLESTSTESQGLAQLQTLINTTRSPDIKYSALRALAGTYYYDEDYEQAILYWNESLKLQPDNWQVRNNIAYALSAHLGRHEEALTHAEAAFQAAPKEPEALDTLATVKIAVGRADEAVPLLESAVRITRGNPTDVRYMIRLAEAHVAADNPGTAKVVVSEVQALLDRGRQLDEEYQTKLDELLAKLNEG